LKRSLHNFSDLDSANRELEGEAHIGQFTKCVLQAILKKAQSNIE
jgi:hypothetical protein